MRTNTNVVPSVRPPIIPFSDRSAMKMPGRRERERGRDRSPGECLADEIARVFSRPSSSSSSSGNTPMGELLESGREVERLRGEMNKTKVRTRKGRDSREQKTGASATTEGGRLLLLRDG